jgi:hypothetical protein
MRCQVINIASLISIVYDDWAESPSSPTLSSNNIEGNEGESLFAFLFHQEVTSVLTVPVCGVLTNLQLVKRLMIKAFFQNCKRKHYDVNKW